MVAVPPPASAAEPTLTAAALSARLQARTVNLKGYRIEGDVDLGSGVLRHGLSCRDCRFDGDLVDAKGLVVQRTLDLSGSEIHGKVRFVGATFERGLRAPGATFDGLVDFRGAHVAGDVDMRGASFRAAALFGSSEQSSSEPGSATGTFDGTVDFALSEFAQLVTFEDAIFSRTVDFTWTRFAADAVFAGGESDGPTVFRRAAFSGAADFSGRVFTERADFGSTQFLDSADFSQTEFDEPALFSGARFARGGSFLGADFESFGSATAKGKKDPPPPPANSFEGVRADGTLDFSLATFRRPTNFSQTVTTGPLSFDQAELYVRKGLNFSQISVGSIGLSVPAALFAVKGSDPQRQRVLDLIEASAKAHNDLALANDAHYERQVLRSRHYTPVLRALDLVFYRTFAGYFVRPLNPLIALLVAAALLSFYRALPEYRPVDGEPRRPLRRVGTQLRSLFRRDVKAARRFGNGFFDALAAIGPHRGGAGEGPPSRLEVVGYRLLLACALIGLANANPTLRQMFNAFG